jgi:hypothetical protein
VVVFGALSGGLVALHAAGFYESGDLHRQPA